MDKKLKKQIRQWMIEVRFDFALVAMVEQKSAEIVRFDNGVPQFKLTAKGIREGANLWEKAQLP